MLILLSNHKQWLVNGFAVLLDNKQEKNSHGFWQQLDSTSQIILTDSSKNIFGKIPEGSISAIRHAPKMAAKKG